MQRKSETFAGGGYCIKAPTKLWSSQSKTKEEEQERWKNKIILGADAEP
jgi:hypothetical protein